LPQLIATVPYRDGLIRLRFCVELTGPPGPLAFGYDGLVDTGFSGGLRGDSNLHQVLEAMGFQAIDTVAGTADNKVHDAWVYPVRILALVTPTGEVRPPVPVDAFLVCFETGDALVGLGALEQWIVEFDGPGRAIRISLP